MSFRRETIPFLADRKNAILPRSSSSTTQLQYSPLIPFTDLSSPIWKANSVYAACSAAGFLISVATGSHVHLDLIGTGSFAAAALPGILKENAPIHVQWSSYAVFVWAAKLASFLFYRAIQVGNDKRLEGLLLTSTGTFQFWLITLVWNIFCSMPYLLGLNSVGSGIGGSTRFLQTGGILYVIGLCIETLADFQKLWFKKSNPGKFCSVGLWSTSQRKFSPQTDLADGAILN